MACRRSWEPTQCMSDCVAWRGLAVLPAVCGFATCCFGLLLRPGSACHPSHPACLPARLPTLSAALQTAGSPGASTLTAATVAATTPWVPGGAEGMLLCSNSAGGDTSLAMAVQQHLLLASTAKAGSAAAAAVAAALAAAAPVDKENWEQQQQAAAGRQATLTAAKPPLAAAAAAGVPASPPKQLTSSNVRMKLHALLENV